MYIHPTQTLINEYQLLQQEEQNLREQFAREAQLPAQTHDGVSLKLMMNTGLEINIEGPATNVSDGVGQHRTETWFMQHHDFPTQQAQHH